MTDDVTVADVITLSELEGDRCDEIVLSIAEAYVLAVNDGINPAEAAGAATAAVDALCTHAGVPFEQVIVGLADINNIEVRYDNPDDDVLPDGGRVPDECRQCARCDADAIPGSRFCFGHSEVRPDGGYGEERLYSDEHRNEIMKQQAGAMERAADALELLAGMQMMRFEYNEDMPSYSVEGLVEEARFYARGGRDE